MLTVGSAEAGQRTLERGALLLQRVAGFSLSSSTSAWPALTRSPRLARMRLTRPSASDEIVT
ncbi:MAG: hypothetical protein R2712_28615 [Vicinamibacterales bacterium]